MSFRSHVDEEGFLWLEELPQELNIDKQEITPERLTLNLHDILAASYALLNTVRTLAKEDWKKKVANILFQSLCSRASTILVSSPKYMQEQKPIENWDSQSMSTLTRSLMEARISFHYLAADDVEMDEWMLRIAIMRLHDAHKIKEILNHQGSTEDSSKLSKIIDKLMLEVMQNPRFPALSKHHWGNIKAGKEAYTKPIKELCVPARISLSSYSWHQSFWSHHVHAFPVFLTRGSEIGSGHHTVDEERRISKCLRFTNYIMVCSHEEICKLYGLSNTR